MIAAVILAVAPVTAQTRQERLESHVRYFASDSLRGREAGSPDALKAAMYIKDQYTRIGLKPFFGDDLEVVIPYANFNCLDIVGVIEGSDPQLKDEYIVLGAHYDHLGVKEDGQVYNGADDNASGSAALIEVARELYARRAELRRSVVIAAFDAEEIGLYGSSALAEKMAREIGLEKVKLMMSLDMVGWLRASGHLELEGVATIRNGRRLLNAEAQKYSLDIKGKRFEDSIFTATDTRAFAEAQVPTLAVTTGLKSPYHKPEDDADLIDYPGMDKVTAFVAGATADFASDPSFAPSGRVAAIHSGRSRVLELGVGVGMTNSHVDFSRGSVITRSACGVSAGLTAQVNMGVLGIVSGAVWEMDRSRYPAGGSVYDDPVIYRQDAVKVPLVFQIQNRGASRAFIGIGAYGSWLLGSRADSALLDPEQMQYGTVLRMGFKLPHVCLSYDLYRQLNPLFTDFNVTRMVTNSLSVSYIF